MLVNRTITANKTAKIERKLFFTIDPFLCIPLAASPGLVDVCVMILFLPDHGYSIKDTNSIHEFLKDIVNFDECLLRILGPGCSYSINTGTVLDSREAISAPRPPVTARAPQEVVAVSDSRDQ
jgi:hypothetical protein